MTRVIHIHVHTADNSEFEGKHPRASNGEFGSGGRSKGNPTSAAEHKVAARAHRQQGNALAAKLDGVGAQKHFDAQQAHEKAAFHATEATGFKHTSPALKKAHSDASAAAHAASARAHAHKENT